LNVDGDIYTSSGFTAKTIEKTLKENAVDPKALGKYTTVVGCHYPIQKLELI
jgi:hypothetical protein